eukprot:546753-Pelagomonas_calceolata.AAC.2
MHKSHVFSPVPHTLSLQFHSTGGQGRPLAPIRVAHPVWVLLTCAKEVIRRAAVHTCKMDTIEGATQSMLLGIGNNVGFVLCSWGFGKALISCSSICKMHPTLLAGARVVEENSCKPQPTSMRNRTAVSEQHGNLQQ